MEDEKEERRESRRRGKRRRRRWRRVGGEEGLKEKELEVEQKRELEGDDEEG